MSMNYPKDTWLKRLAERSDLSSYVAHLTRPATVDTEDFSAVEVLLMILKDRSIRGSSTRSGFIVGATEAVCFQDAPPHALAQNLWFEA